MQAQTTETMGVKEARAFGTGPRVSILFDVHSPAHREQDAITEGLLRLLLALSQSGCPASRAPPSVTFDYISSEYTLLPEAYAKRSRSAKASHATGSASKQPWMAASPTATRLLDMQQKLQAWYNLQQRKGKAADVGKFAAGASCAKRGLETTLAAQRAGLWFPLDAMTDSIPLSGPQVLPPRPAATSGRRTTYCATC